MASAWKTILGTREIPLSHHTIAPFLPDLDSPLKIMMDRGYLFLCLPLGQYGSPFCPITEQHKAQAPLLQAKDRHLHWHSYFWLVLSCQTAAFAVETCEVCVDTDYNISMCFLNPSGFWSSQHTDRNVKLIMLKILLIFLRWLAKVRDDLSWFRQG